MNDISAAIFYLHIPKTGGQSLATRLASAFLPHESHILLDTLRFPLDVQKLDGLLAKKRFIEAHVEGQVLCDARELDILVTVRDPLDQLISNLRHIRREPGSVWHRSSLKLSPAQFFDQFGSFFSNHQTRYLLSAFVPMGWLMEQHGTYRSMHAHLFEVIDKLRWLIPTTSIDEFVTLWSVETKRHVPNAAQVVNIAPSDEMNVEEVRDALVSRPHLYAFDLLLHEIAKEQFAAYRKNVLQNLTGRNPEDSRRAFFSNGAGIWLTENWYDPEFTEYGYAWWSGPSTQSGLLIHRGLDHTFLCFDVLVVNGIEHNNIDVFAKGDFRKLDVTIKRKSSDVVSYYVSLAPLQDEDELAIVVPNCMAAIMTTENDDSLIRRSFLATDWALVDAIPNT